MKIKIIALAFLCMLMLASCADNSSSEKSKTTESTTTTTTANKDISFEATVLGVLDSGYIYLIESDYVIDSANGKIGKAKLRYDESVGAPSDIKKGDKIKVTVYGDVIGMNESDPPIIFDIKSIKKIS